MKAFTSLHDLWSWIVIALFLAACAPAPMPTPTTVPVAPPTATLAATPPSTTVPVATLPATRAPTAIPTPSTQISDPWGVVTVKKASKIRVAVTVISNTRQGQDLMQGAQMAATDYGKDVAPGFDLELVTFDDSGTVPFTSAAEKIAKDAQVVSVIGTMSSDTMIAQSDILDKAHVVMISPSAAADPVTARGLETVNRTMFNEALYATATAKYALTQKNFKSVAVIYQDRQYGQSYSRRFKEEFEKTGGTIVAMESVSATETDYRTLLTKIALTKPQALLAVGASDEMQKAIASQKNSAGLKDVVFLAVGIQNAADFLTLGANAEGSYLASPGRPRGGIAEDEFFRKYSASGGKRESVVFAHYAYDAVGVMVKALKSVAVVNNQGDLEIGRQALARAVRATKGYAGATGDVTFDKNGDRVPAGAIIDIFVVQRGRWITP